MEIDISQNLVPDRPWFNSQDPFKRYHTDAKWSGMGVGIAVPSSAIYIAEISSPSLRGILHPFQISFKPLP